MHNFKLQKLVSQKKKKNYKTCNLNNLLVTYGGVWFVYSNNNFQFLNNVSRISTHFFTHTYFYKCF